MEAVDHVPTESKPKPSSVSSDITVRDLILWRRKKLNTLILLGSTAIWVLLEFSPFKLVTLASWSAMFVLTGLFLYGNLVRLVRKEEPNMLSTLEITEETSFQVANSIRQSLEDVCRWLLRMGTGADLVSFAKTVAVLWLLSYIGKLMDFITLLYLGLMLAWTAPLLYVKNERKIKAGEERMKMLVGKAYGLVDEKVLMKIKSVMIHKVDEKEKKGD